MIKSLMNVIKRSKNTFTFLHKFNYAKLYHHTWLRLKTRLILHQPLKLYNLDVYICVFACPRSRERGVVRLRDTGLSRRKAWFLVLFSVQTMDDNFNRKIDKTEQFFLNSVCFSFEPVRFSFGFLKNFQVSLISVLQKKPTESNRTESYTFIPSRIYIYTRLK